MHTKTCIKMFLTLFYLQQLRKVIATSKTSVSRSEIDSRIVGGEAISILAAPWQVSVRLKIYEQQLYGSGHICGGSVVSQRVVITAAHCIASQEYAPITYRSPSEFTLVMGSVYLNQATAYTLQYDVLEIIVNSGFNITTLVNDVALFFINGYIPTNWPTVAAIPLNTYIEANGTVCSVSGWGATTYNGYVSNELLGANVPIVSYNTCDINYGNISMGMICAGYMQAGGVDACQGDSGGPLVCNGTLAGIVSWGYRCAVPGYPGIYTNVSYYNNWIVTNNNSFNYNLYRNEAPRNFKLILSFIMPIFILVAANIFK